MKRVLFLILIFGCYLNAIEMIIAKRVDSVEQIDSLNYKPTEIIVYPQTTLRLNDKDTNRVNSNLLAKRVQVLAFFDNKKLKVVLKWRDDTNSTVLINETDSYADGFAVQFAIDGKSVKELPYIAMGDRDKKVIIYLHKNQLVKKKPNFNNKIAHNLDFLNKNLSGDNNFSTPPRSIYQKTFLANGYGHMEEVKEYNSSSSKMYYKNGLWYGELTRDLVDNNIALDKGVNFVAFAIWNGAKKQRDGIKRISGWLPIKLESVLGGEEILAEFNNKPKADIKNGEKLVLEHCSMCHRYKEVQKANQYQAPNLSNVGGYMTRAYIKSALKPNAHITRKVQNKKKMAQPWSIAKEKNAVSIMPKFSKILDEKSINDIIGFLQTLKSEVEK